jgi:quercetin dioxygenase-like cupin family protein
MPILLLPAIIAAGGKLTGRMKPFPDAFPADNIRHHFVGQDQARGVYAKELRIPAGVEMVSHSHQYDHLSILARGVVQITIDGVASEMSGPRAMTIKAGEAHTLRAITDAVWFCIHPTDETDAARVDEAILREAT